MVVLYMMAMEFVVDIKFEATGTRLRTGIELLCLPRMNCVFFPKHSIMGEIGLVHV